MSFDEIKKIADSIGKLGALLISGGEPFLRKDLAEICEYFIQKSKTRLISLPTNGSLKEEALAFVRRMHHQCRLRIYVSVEGLKETHNRIRGLDCYDRSIKLLKALVELKKECNFTPLAMITVSNQNYGEISAIAKVLNEIGVHYSITPVRGTPKDSKFRAPTAEEWENLIKELCRYRNFYGNNYSFNNNKINILKKTHRKIAVRSLTKMYCSALNGKRGFICDAGLNTAVLDYDGKVFLCELTAPIGNVKDYNYDFNRLWFSPEAEQRRTQVTKCVCTHACFINTRYMRSVEWLSQLLS